jgi:hypothetical protein
MLMANNLAWALHPARLQEWHGPSQIEPWEHLALGSATELAEAWEPMCLELQLFQGQLPGVLWLGSLP